MRRTLTAVFLSLLIHSALLVAFPWRMEDASPREVIRVSLRQAEAKAEQPRTGDAAGAPQQAGAPAENTPLLSPPSEPAVQAAPEPVEVPSPHPTPPVPPEPRVEPIVAAETPKPKATPMPETVKPTPPRPEVEQVVVAEAPKPKPTPPKPEPRPSVSKPQPIPAQPAKQEAPKEANMDAAAQAPAAPTTGSAPANTQAVGGAQPAAPAAPRGDAASGVVDAAKLRIVKKTAAEYPMISRKRKDQGTVVLLIRIESGRVTKVDVERSSGHKPLDESASRAVREWQFDTTGYGDALTARIPFSFTLK